MLLKIPPHTGWAPTKKIYLAPSVNSAESEKACLGGRVIV